MQQPHVLVHLGGHDLLLAHVTSDEDAAATPRPATLALDELEGTGEAVDVALREGVQRQQELLHGERDAGVG
jgi:hypothetical protein